MKVGVSGAARGMRIGVLFLAATMAFVAATVDHADAKRRRAKAPSYNPPYASIVVDANSGKTLEATNADSSRYPASLTKVMTLYLLFERLEAGRLKLDSEMNVSEYAAKQAPTKLGLREGSTLMVEDAIKGLVTKSANDASVVIAEAIGGSEEQFARMMTQRARSLGMTKTVYRNASGLPDMEQVTTARDQALLGRAIQERFPKYYAYFSTSSFRFRGKVIRGHNRLLGRVDGVDGIKTGYTRASGFNLLSSIKRGNRHLVAVVLGGRSSGTRDTAMRGLLAEYITEGATVRTASVLNRGSETKVAAADELPPVAEPKAAAKVERKVEAKTEPKPLRLASAGPDAVAAAAPAAKEPVMLSSGVVAERVSPPVPGSVDPITPTKVKTVAVRAGAVKTASAAPSGAASPLPAPIAEAPAQTASVAARELPPLASNHGTGQGILGVLPASAMAYADTHASAPAAAAQRVASAAPVAAAPAKPVMRSGWIVQVGAYDIESEARERLDMARGRVKLLGKADPFTEPVARGDKTMYRARFAGLDKDDAEAACKALKRRDIACFTLKN